MSRYLTSLLLLVSLSGFAQELPWLNLEVSSEALKIDQQIQVYLPDDYESSDKEYPVLYVIDAHWYFFNGVSIQKTLRGNKIMPKMIVVGIDMKNRPYRDSLFNNSWDEIVTFIGSELPAYVDNNFRTKQESVVFGWESASFMVSELLFQENPPFDGYIMSNGGYLTDEMVSAFQKGNSSNKYAFIANSEKDIYTIDHTKEMIRNLVSNSLPGLNWNYELFNSEVHETLAYQSMYYGLKHFYHNYHSMDYASIAEFHELGGLPYLKKYFEERAERFGTDPEIDNATKNTLIWLSWKRDNFDSFKYFMTEFSEVLETRRYASAYWQNRLGQFYLKYDHHDVAITYFNRGITEYPNDRYMAQMFAGLGKAYSAINKRKLAKANFRKAIEVAREQSDPLLNDYQQLLDGVR